MDLVKSNKIGLIIYIGVNRNKKVVTIQRSLKFIEMPSPKMLNVTLNILYRILIISI